MRTAAWAGLALAVPLVARSHLDRRIDGDLEPALTAALGVPVAVDSLDATLTGLVRLTGLTAGATPRSERSPPEPVTGSNRMTPWALSVDAVEAAFDPAAIAAGRLDPAEIRVARPRVRIGSTADPVWTRLESRLEHHRARAADGTPSRLQHLVVTGGELEIELPGGGTVRAAGVALRPRGSGARLVAGPVAVTWRAPGGLEARARFARAAADLGGDAPHRLIAVGGEVSLGHPGGERLTLARATATAGVAGPPDQLRLTGRVAGSRHATVTAAVAIDGARGRLDLEAVPLAFLGPLVRPLALVEAARASGSVEFARGPGAELHGSAALAIDGVLVTHPLVSSAPVALDGSITLRGSLRRLAGRRLVAIDELRLERAALAVDLHGLLEWPDGAHLPARGQLAFAMPETPCAGALAAVPDGLRQYLAGLEVTGSAGGSIDLAFDRADPDATQLVFALDVDRCRVVTEPALSDPMRMAAPFDLALADGTALRIGDGSGHVALARLPRHVSGAFVAAEDARFFRHGGFDAEQIERSLAIDLDAGKLLRGGSTISQQLVKNVYLGPERTLARKLQEAVITWRIEARLDKRLILERYLDLIELGDGVRGIGTAARHWFARPAERLTIRQAAFLAALTPAPRTLSRLVRASGGRLPPEVADRVDVVLRAMRVAGVIDRATYARARLEPLRLAPTAMSANPF